MYGHPLQLAENPRTKTKAAIKRASRAGRAKMRQLDRQLLAELEGVYKQAADDIRAYLIARAGDENTLRIEVMQDLLSQAESRLNQLAAERNGLLESGLLQAADIGVEPFIGALDIGTSLTKIADDAARFVTQFVAEDGLQLSQRIWKLDAQAREVVAERIQQAVVRGWSASKAAEEFLKSGLAVPRDVAGQISKAAGTQVGRDVWDGLMKDAGSPMDNAMRVFRTEINRAHGEAYQAAAFEHPDVIGTRFLLSPAHPRVDICDMHAKVNRYGLGPGVYPKGKNPWPAHPNTLSFTEVVFADEVSDEDREGKEDRISWLKRQHPGVQESVLGSRRKRAALQHGLIKESQISTPWRVLKKRFERQGIDIDSLKPTPLIAPIAPGTATSMKEAMNYCRTQGQKTGWEWVVCYNTKTSDLLLKKTSKHPAAVNFSQSEMALFENKANSVQLVHNHPSSSSLSLPDLQISYNVGVHSVVAVGHDGSTYIGKSLVGDVELKNKSSRISKLVRDEMWDMIESSKITPSQASILDPHLRNRILQRLGLITYRTENLSGEIKTVLDQIGKTRFDQLTNSIQQAIEKGA
jgi:hypothetical protein